MKRILAYMTPVLLLPRVAFAQDFAWANNILSGLQTIVDGLIPFFIAVALVAFLYGLARYIFAAGSEEAKVEGRKIMVAGIIGLFVAVAIWGIIQVLSTLTGISTGGGVNVPQTPAQGAGGGGPGAQQPAP